MKKIVLTLLIFAAMVLPSFAKVDFPYGEINIKMPPLTEPYPGIGSHFSSVSKGIGTVMWNPASLVNIGTTEALLSYAGMSGTTRFDKTFRVEDLTFEADVSGKAGAFTGAFYFDTLANSTSVTTRDVAGHYNYLTESSGITYQQALRINDWLAAGVIYRGPVEVNANLAGDFPTTAKYNLNLSGATLEGAPMWFGDDNKVNYSYTIPGTTTTVTSQSAGPVWNSFITQEAVLPLTSFSEFRNNVSVKSDLTASLAGKVKGISFGVNFTPMAAEMNIDNALRTVVNSGTSDLTVYAPNFDINSAESIATWFADPTKYGAAAGYTAKIEQVPAGQAVADGKYRGFYTASTMRMDFGMMYDVSDNFRLGVAYENLNAAGLNFSGNGRSTYAQTRFGTVEFSDILDPAQNKGPDFFKDTFSPVAGTENYYLYPQMNFALPQRLRFGGAFIKPVLLALDYETQLNPIVFRAQNSSGVYTDMKISNLNTIKIGMDFNWLKFGTTLLMKPSVSGIDANTQSNINKAFKYFVLPIRLDLGTSFNLWGLKTNLSGGFNGTSILDALQFNTINGDLSKILFYNLSLNKDYWTVSYLATIDPGSTVAGYYAAKDTNPSKTFGWGDVRWISTYQISYKF
ncbi:hypothetical protein A2276_08110 [candidate division WOR-1 bacterium RIFOXYA12_FULL_43_27]|uniref:DUF5723 domain-containing protein n=1 Tax=candidate division WOR-1 bacterium RIFOXYC2_FULL_46_14 TaxID=1802587 RepID=A0A1F4U673_UNCSA|nr:MAG: hypothetical protein A2276_08110 [candidate division WOR-1 bacterium RIFOXYA12_FULL_43_27]OGC20559.1 MAG: hypothetical protein A2292_05935 [candidate division WOR-1 bacterium RIFOXYB2_FULL_46_45]OGC31704.1 MAG: hypothetical protein A2232_05515 [candidate division WOR-1 bacterium RIFOXYA2_FULL_46_56]OGC40401.1 MAG: hypothetical protein A2438_03965 [candidate division WOR-1 bacterium RIFOXYC2_FULL_46_14]